MGSFTLYTELLSPIYIIISPSCVKGKLSVSELSEFRRNRARLLAMSCSVFRYVGHILTNMATEQVGTVQSSYRCYGRSKVTEGTTRCDNSCLPSRRKTYTHTYIKRTDRQTDRQTDCYLNNSSFYSYPYKHRLLFNECIQ
jgi:uncharacterized protein YbgA (DUF1722 family)